MDSEPQDSQMATMHEDVDERARLSEDDSKYSSPVAVAVVAWFALLALVTIVWCAWFLTGECTTRRKASVLV
jgi:hypothetical protein